MPKNSRLAVIKISCPGFNNRNNGSMKNMEEDKIYKQKESEIEEMIERREIANQAFKKLLDNLEVNKVRKSKKRKK